MPAAALTTGLLLATGPMLAAELAYRPFIDPINLQRGWYFLLLPLSLGIAIAYKAVRVRDMRAYPREVAVMTVQIIIAMLALGAVSFILVQHVLPMILPMN